MRTSNKRRRWLLLAIPLALIFLGMPPDCVAPGGSGGGGGGGPPGGPTAPPHTVSKYVSTVNSTLSYESGCLIGDYHEAAGVGGGNQGGLMVLSFGAAWSSGGSYGTLLLDGETFASVSQIEGAMHYFVLGYNACNENLDHHIKIAVGTTNYVDDPPDPSASVSYLHGQAWAAMVNSLMSWVQSSGWAGRIVIDGAIDIESGSVWGNDNITRDWVQGYDSVNNRLYYNFGDAACNIPPNYNGTYDFVCNNSWSIDDIEYVSFRNSAALPLPQIYLRYDHDAYNAKQWQNVKLRSVVHWGETSPFPGTLTQYAACQQSTSIPTCAVQGTDNLPAEGWKQLLDELNLDPLTAQSGLAHSTDIAWLDP